MHRLKIANKSTILNQAGYNPVDRFVPNKAGMELLEMTAFSIFENDENLVDPLVFEANSRGEVTASQKKRFYRELFVNSVLALVICVTLFIILFCILFFLLRINLGVPVRVLMFTMFLLGISPVAYYSLKLFIKYSRFEGDYQDRVICKEKALVVYEQRHFQSGYFLRVHAQSFYSSLKSMDRFIPGMIYDVMYLKESKFLLSAQISASNPPYPVNATVPPRQTQIAINQALSIAFGFSPKELAANRNGQISESQKSGLFLDIGRFLGRPLGVRYTKLFIVSVCFIVIPMVLAEIATGNFFILIGPIVLAIIILPLFLSTRKDISTVNVQQVAGIGTKLIRNPLSRSRNYYYKISGKEFVISYDVYTALIDGLPYRAYYLGTSNQLLSVEVMGDS